MAGTKYLLKCLECLELEPHTFDTPGERDSWAAKHTIATGHDTWIVEESRYLFTEHADGTFTVDQ